MEPITARYRDHLMKMMAVSRAHLEVGGHNVFQEGAKDILPFIDRIVEDHLLPGSTILHLERLEALLDAARAGEPCLLLLEHFSNFDLPVLHYLLRKAGPRGAEVAESIVAVAGIKLNEDNPVVAAFSEAYTRLVIYPSRSIDALKAATHLDPTKVLAELMKSVEVNRQSMKALAELKTKGRLVLVFPTGTRFRPWDPQTGRGVREIDSYVKSFSKFCFVSINGNIFRLNPAGGEMVEDLLCKDRVIFDVSEITPCAAFREEAKSRVSGLEDRKQAVADAIMARLGEMHAAVAAEYPAVVPEGGA
jgi:glycerol-3-phosphate O-acyltransferase